MRTLVALNGCNPLLGGNTLPLRVDTECGCPASDETLAKDEQTRRFIGIMNLTQFSIAPASKSLAYSILKAC